ncbi:MAG: hypothetical protein JKX80_02625, partial [Candidatus Pacebacteria bacterium]|nr:hypothetical protein [Candidatus Paceibacterota bacterium]
MIKYHQLNLEIEIEKLVVITNRKGVVMTQSSQQPVSTGGNESFVLKQSPTTEVYSKLSKNGVTLWRTVVGNSVIRGEDVVPKEKEPVIEPVVSPPEPPEESETGSDEAEILPVEEETPPAAPVQQPEQQEGALPPGHPLFADTQQQRGFEMKR